MQVKPRVRKAYTWFGRSLALGGLVFVAIRLQHDFDRLPTQWVTFRNLALLGPLLVILLTANHVLAGAWYHIMVWLYRPTTLRVSFKVYARSQIGKYLPGNIFQFVGRQTLGTRVGFPHAPLAKSTVFEIGLISIAGFFVGLFAVVTSLTAVSLWHMVVLYAAVLVSIVILAFLFQWQRLLVAFLLCILYLLTTGSAFLLSLQWYGRDLVIGESALLVVSGYVLGWLAGLLTPGAPAGIGVREAVLIGLLEGVVALPLLTLCVIVMRIVSVVADILFFLFGGFRLKGYWSS